MSLEVACPVENTPEAAPSDAGLNVLQGFVFPDEARADRTSLYVSRWVGKILLANAQGLPIAEKTQVEFCSFFNSFSHRKWLSTTGIEEIALLVKGAGPVSIRVLTFTDTAAAWEIARADLVLSDEGRVIHLPPLSSIAGQILAIDVETGDSAALLKSVAWVTRMPPTRLVRLAAVITTFKREAAAARAIESFSSTTCNKVPLGSAELYVVDNGASLPHLERPHVTVFPNPNLGGAGGFARGLSEAINAGTFSHVLFMDDDASCEPESVWRSISLLAYVKDAGSAIAGAMLLHDRPTFQYEKGATLHKGNAPSHTWEVQHQNRELSDIAVVCSNDTDDNVNYGAWWFFAFPLDKVRHMPFPFFVRGDDVDFSLSNGFNILTLNGVATWCDNFGYKLNPVTEYLAFRSWFALALMYGSRKRAKLALQSAFDAAWTLSKRFDYAGMNAILAGIEDAMNGPSFFRDSPAPIARLAEIRSLRQERPPVKNDFELLSTPSQPAKHWYSDMLRKIWSGHLLPSGDRADVRHRRIAWEFGSDALIGASKAVVGRGANLDTLILDRSAFLPALFRMKKLKRNALRKLNHVQDLYQSQASSLRTLDYWKPHFEIDSQSKVGK